MQSVTVQIDSPTAVGNQEQFIFCVYLCSIILNVY